MYPIAGQTAGPNGLKFSRKPMDTLGVTKAIKILKFVFFKNRFFKSNFFLILRPTSSLQLVIHNILK